MNRSEQQFPMSWDKWRTTLPISAFRDPDAVAPKATGESVENKKISTSRDNYGWRSLKGGTHYLGSNKT